MLVSFIKNCFIYGFGEYNNFIYFCLAEEVFLIDKGLVTLFLRLLTLIFNYNNLHTHCVIA